MHTVSGTVGEAVSGVFGKSYDRLMKNGMQDVKTDNDTFYGFHKRETRKG